jgi:dTDP-4-dehydrorhamnose 3,5-epimerase
MEGPYLVPLREIDVPNGNVYHALKSSEDSFIRFGELYFSRIETGKIKGWKRHNSCTLNLIVVQGMVKFLLVNDDFFEGGGRIYREEFTLGPIVNYKRLVVPPGYWMAFKGIGTGENIIANVIDEEHDPQESDSRSFVDFD